MTPFIRVYGCGCLIVLALLGDPAQQYGQQDAVTEKVLAAWSKRQSQTEKIEIEVAQKWLWPKGSKVPTPDKNGKTWPSQDFTGLQKYTLSLENEKLRYHYDGEMYFHFESQDRDGLTKNGFTVNFDGERELSLHTQGNTRHGSREQRERSFFAGSHELIPLMLCFRGPVESYQTIRLSQYRSTGRKVKHEGSSCLEFTLADPKPSVQAYILIEDSPDYPVRRCYKFIKSLPNDIGHQIDIDYSRHESGVLIPSKWSITHLNGKVPLYDRIEGTLQSFRLLDAGVPSPISTTPPPDSFVTELKNGRPVRSFVRDEEGNEVGVNTHHPAKALELVRSGQVKASGNFFSKNLALCLGIVVFLAGMIGLAYFRRRRTAKV